jgi:hypothetical protein
VTLFSLIIGPLCDIIIQIPYYVLFKHLRNVFAVTNLKSVNISVLLL